MYRSPFAFYLGAVLILLLGCTKRGGQQPQNLPLPTPFPVPTSTPQTQPTLLPDHVQLSGPATLLVGECQPYTLTSLNGNEKAAVISDVIFSFTPMPLGNYYSDFLCGQNLASLKLPAGSDTQVFYFKPSAAGNLSLSVQSQLLGNALLNLVVTGTANFGLSPSSNFNFGAIRVGMVLVQEFIISNSGNGPLNGLSQPTGLNQVFHFLGGNFPGTGGNCTDLLAAGQSCTLKIEFSPNAVGDFRSAILFNYTDGVGNHSALLTLQGSGTLPGFMDPSFGTAGVILTNLNGMTDEVRSLVSLPNAKLLAVGNSLNGAGYRFALGRYLSNGSLDTGYGTGGISLYDTGGSSSYALASAQQTDGKTVVVGYQYKNSLYDSAIARFNTDGRIDTTFATQGQAVFTLTSGYDIFTAVTIQADGKIVAGGYRQNTNFDFSLVRLNSSGDLDLGFNGGGIVSSPIGTSSDMLNALVLQTDQKIIVAGKSMNAAGNYDFAIARYRPNGNLDNSFGASGKVVTDFFGIADSANAVKIQTDGKMVVAGNAGAGVQNIFAVARYLSNGALDTSFNSMGKLTHTFSSNDDMTALALQTDGKWVVGGTSYLNSKYSFGVTRINDSGNFDTDFGTNGHVVLNLSSGTDRLYTLSLQNDGRIIAGGSAYNGTSTEFAITRFYP